MRTRPALHPTFPYMFSPASLIRSVGPTWPQFFSVCLCAFLLIPGHSHSGQGTCSCWLWEGGDKSNTQEGKTMSPVHPCLASSTCGGVVWAPLNLGTLSLQPCWLSPMWPLSWSGSKLTATFLGRHSIFLASVLSLCLHNIFGFTLTASCILPPGVAHRDSLWSCTHCLTF
jgi:hypothetical protein